MSKIDFLIVALVVAGIFVCFFLLVPPGTNVHELQEQLAKEQRRNEQLEAKVAEYERQIAKIKRNDAAEIEAIARDRLGYCRDGEEIYPLELPDSQPVETAEQAAATE
ncbi:MAG: septum formation initiator family protein [Victivallales bacterium]|nr:septum formation initiator family protein [Victivallales bacterium]